MSKWQLQILPNTAVFTSTRVMNAQELVVRLIYDEDGDWQALDKIPRKEGDGVVIGVDHIIENQPDTLKGLQLLEASGPGHQVTKNLRGKWKISKIQ